MTSRLLLTLTLTLTLLISLLPIIHAQIGYDAKTKHFLCPSPNTHHCVAGSLRGSSIISCYEQPSQPGIAVCAFNGTGYTLSNPRVRVYIPETSLCEDIPLIRAISDDGTDGSATHQSEPESKGGIFEHDEKMIVKSPVLWPTPALVPQDMSLSSFVGTPSMSTSTLGGGTVCLDPWDGGGSRVGDWYGEALTLNIVLVIPTQGVIATGMQAQPSSGIFVGQGQGQGQTVGVGVSSPFSTPTEGSGLLDSSTPGLESSMPPSKAGGIGWNGSGVAETGLSNDVVYDPGMTWFYMNPQDNDEILLFKSFDTKKEAIQCVPHSASTHQSIPSGAAPRDRIEVRALAFTSIVEQ
ncbi:hypothetical protein BDW59DRAFT_166014 [Aspergillus cavernicola]|uniref:Uncharacterized protein n=1 Tax=Aspergillus cavernicola TaxID=176166 RepID=A0ABR4HPI8_9EURO